MREIKFRAWRKDTKVWEYGIAMGMDGKLCTNHNEDYELVQYTGLKDKNGKEIYEGDVVCWVTDVVVDSEGGFNRTEPEGQIGTVKYGSYAFYVEAEKGSEFYSYGEQMFVFEELEVIGNIYENPELLKQ